jgi:putative ABC transport system permease protein
MGWPKNQARLFHALLYSYPAEFRHEYGAEMEQLFADRLEAEPRWRVWLEAISDLAYSAAREHAHILASDVRYGARVLAVTPGFTAIALLVIALGIGATTAVFSVVNAVLLRSLPYGHPEKLVYLWSPNRNFKGVPDELGPNAPDYYDWQRMSHSFSSMTLFQQKAVNVIESGSAQRIGAAFVTPSFFRTFEVRPAIGRILDANDDQPGHERVAVISDRVWRSRFGSDPRVIGRRMQVNRENYTVVGVMPKEFGYPFDGDVPYDSSGFGQTDLWLPLAFTSSQKTDRAHFASGTAVARLRGGIAAATAESELNAIQTRLDPLYPQMWRGWTVLVRPLAETIIGPVEKMLWLLLGAVGLVLLIAISNVAHLLLARFSSRAHELGIRTALGAERARIIRQLLTESLMLSGVGGLLGIAVAYAALPVLIRLDPGGIPRFESAAVDGRMLMVAVLLSLAGGIASGLAPAWSA